MGAKPKIDGPITRLQGTVVTTADSERLTELRRLAILDTRPDESFDRISRLVARTLGVPSVVISLVDESREWFKSRVGLQVTQIDREVSFADYIVRERRSLAVQNAALDPRFASSPLVQFAPKIRACLGIPLYSMGQQPIGALCAMDTRPRDFSADETAILTDFAAIVQEAIQTHANAARQDHILRLLDSENKHREFERRMKSITNSIPALIGYWNTDLRCEFANDAYRQLFGLTPEQMLGRHLSEVLGEELYRLNVPHAEAALAGEAQRFQRRVMKRDGTQAETEGQYLPDVDEQGNVRGFFVLVTDVTELTVAKGELEISNAQLLKQSTTDFLTGLANRLVFSDRCEAAAIQYRESGKAYGLILLDLDDFKLINDEYGHAVGDEVLRAVGKILGSELRDREDLAVRLGGEEFAVLCFGDFTADMLYELADRIRTRFHKTTVPTPRGPLSFTSSFGIACSHAEDSGWKNIFARADVALYKAKSSGKDRIEFGPTNVLSESGRSRSVRPAAR